MKAVNLIPRDDLANRGAAGRSGGGAYALLAVLAVAVVAVAAWTHLGATAKSKDAEATRISAEATQAEADAGKLKVYTDFAALSQSRTETVGQLAKSRFDWPHALRDVARTLPSDAWLTSLRASVTPTVSVEGTPDPLRQSIAAPAIEVAGCARTQDDVAASVVAMRQIDDVQRVSLSSSTAQGGGTSGACGKSAPKALQFSMTVFFNTPTTSAATTTTAAGTTGTATAATATTTGGTTP
jgi:Tfp pilus assembly protein PilN